MHINMAGDVGNLGSLILGLATSIQNLGDNWYRADAGWKKFPGQVELLREKLDLWEREARNRGLSSDHALIKRLSAAKGLLQKEQVKLEKRARSGGPGCWPRLSTTLFPAKVGLSIEAATDAFNEIPGMLKSRQETVEVLDRAMMCRAVSDSIASDTRYVPLEDTEANICRALDNVEGPAVVLLYGGPGFGKSTVARNMVVHYNNLSLDDDNRMFDLVFFLNCGPGAKAEDTQLEIIRRLGSEPQASPEDDERTRSSHIEKQLRSLLTAQKILLILDDVNDGGFLQKIVKLCGTKVKCLVTSQHANLCQSQLDSTKYINIAIQDIDQEIARKILASHVQLPNCQIPVHLQELADNMIAETEFIPLALSSLANAIDHNQPDDLEVWEDASAHFFEALRSEVPTTILEGRYIRSFWATMGLAIDSLNAHARKVLLLTHVCARPSIPEEIVQILYRSTKFTGISGNFSIVRSELVNRQLIKINISYNNLGKQRTWSMHSLQKRYIEEEMKAELDSMFSSLTDEENDAHGLNFAHQIEAAEEKMEDVEEKMVTAVCALYLDMELAKRAASKMGTALGGSWNQLMKRAIEPVTLLLGRLVLNQWTKTARNCAIEVFLAYIWQFQGDFNGEGISYLLGLPTAAPAMAKALKDMVGLCRSLDHFKLVVENTPHLKMALVDQLAEGVESNVQIATIEILARLVWFVDLFYNLFVGSLNSSNNNALKGIIRLLATASDPLVQMQCAVLLRNMAGVVTFRGYEKIEILVGWPGLLDGLINSLSKDENPLLQEHAAEALRCIARAAPMNLKVDIINQPRVLSELVKSLSKDFNPTMQKEVGMMFIYLVDGIHENKVKIVNYASSIALEGLMRLLYRHDNASLQLCGAKAFATLAKVEDNSCIMRIKATKGVLDGLISLLTMDNPKWWDIQSWALEALLLLDPTRANEQCLYSGQAYRMRACLNSSLGMYTRALGDLDEASKMNFEILRDRYVVRAKMGDFEGALADLKLIMGDAQDDQSFYLQERGVVKRMMGDLDGALVDLSKGLEELENDINVYEKFQFRGYERFKHRGYVKFLMNDEEGARADAKCALSTNHAYFRRRSKYLGVEVLGDKETYLGACCVEYLGYKLE